MRQATASATRATLEDAIPPVVHAVDLVAVEEGRERPAGKGGEVPAQPLDELGDAAVTFPAVIASGVADEDVIGHGRCLVGDTAWSGLTFGRGSTPPKCLTEGLRHRKNRETSGPGPGRGLETRAQQIRPGLLATVSCIGSSP